MSTPRILLAGGGTAGHVTPALATAEALRAARPDVVVEFVGTAAGLESRLVPAAGWTLHAVPAAPLRRQRLATAARVPVVVLRAARRVAGLIRERGVVAACGFGGYVSGPLALGAWLARVPLVVHEQNAAPGVANRVAARWARTVAVSVPGTAAAFAHPTRVVVTGNPVRAELVAGGDDRARRDAACHSLGLDPRRRTLLAFGGSLGARRINDALLAAAPRWSAPDRLQLLHATGTRDHDRVAAAWRDTAGRLRVVCEPFLERMDLAYAAADVAVCRAGASTIAELTVSGLPSVLVPYPHAAADEQTANAHALVTAGAATLVADRDLDGPALVAATEPLLCDDARRAAAATAARGLGRPDAANRLAAVVLAAAGLDGGAGGGRTAASGDRSGGGPP